MNSTFPDAWKYAEVIPLPKESNHEEPTNNRPLSLLPTISKICEKVVLNQFSSYLTKNKRLNCHQSGNRKYHSTETLNIFTTDSFLDAMDQKKVTVLVLLDLSKAFDSLSYQILLRKLVNVGVSQTALKWFESYLSGRSQAVRIGTSVSTPLPLLHGVPQGAILSPLLFNIYINDLPSVPRHCILKSFVDDSKLLLSFYVKDLDDSSKKVEADLLEVTKWCCNNCLLLNPDITKLLLLGTRQMLNKIPDELKVVLLGKQLTPVPSAKDLGIIIDSNLSYDEHIVHLVSSCMASLCRINRVKHLFSSKSLTTIINALVLNKLFYCSSVWRNTSQQNIKKLQSVQNFAARIISGTRKFDHITPVLNQLQWLPVKHQIRLRDNLLVFKCLNRLAPDYLCEKFYFRSKVHNRNTRNCNQLNIPKYRSTTGQRTFTYRGVKVWNERDNSIKYEIDSFKQFKTNLKAEFLKIV